MDSVLREETKNFHLCTWVVFQLVIFVDGMDLGQGIARIGNKKRSDEEDRYIL